MATEESTEIYDKNRAYYEKNTEKEKKRVITRKLQNAKIINDYKLAQGCHFKDKCLSKKHRVTRRQERKMTAQVYNIRRKRNFVREDYSIEPSKAGLEFHHKDPNDKFKEISLMVYHGYSLKRIFEEIAKCIILCRKCHMEKYHKKEEG